MTGHILSTDRTGIWCPTIVKFGFFSAFGDEMDLDINLAGPGFVSVTRRQARGIVFLRERDGKLLWEITGKPVDPLKREMPYLWTTLVDGERWFSSWKYDPLIGEVKGKLPVGLPTQSCAPSVLVGNLLTQSRHSAYTELPLSADPQDKARTFTFEAARGGCMQGMVPANGMFYTSQNNCECAPGRSRASWGLDRKPCCPAGKPGPRNAPQKQA
jgi:hypothetical protein